MLVFVESVMVSAAWGGCEKESIKLAWSGERLDRGLDGPAAVDEEGGGEAREHALLRDFLSLSLGCFFAGEAARFVGAKRLCSHAQAQVPLDMALAIAHLDHIALCHW